MAGMPDLDVGIRHVLAHNVRWLMDHSPDISSQLRLARRAGVGQATIDRVLGATVGTSIDVVEKIANAYGINPYLLLHPNMPMAAREAEFLARMRGLVNERDNNVR